MIAILMSTYNGEKYLDEQIRSIVNQTAADIKLVIRDDGSNDSTMEILNQWKLKEKDKVVVKGEENIGFKKSFLKLLYEAEDADYYAFSDQDDIWDRDKLDRAAAKMKKYDSIPCVYYSNVLFCDKNGNNISTSNYQKLDNIWKALLYNQVAGCTMVINRIARNIIVKKELNTLDFSNILAHDGWIFRICAGAGSKIIFDPIPHIKYRQHGKSVIGSGTTFSGVWLRRLKMLSKDNKNIKLNLSKELFLRYSDYLTPEARDAVECFNSYRNSMINTITLLRKDIYTNNVLMNIALLIAIISHRI